jgi:hypothetical protein
LINLVAEFGEQVAFLNSFIGDLDGLIDTTVDAYNGLTIT